MLIAHVSAVVALVAVTATFALLVLAAIRHDNRLATLASGVLGISIIFIGTTLYGGAMEALTLWIIPFAILFIVGGLFIVVTAVIGSRKTQKQ